MLNPKEQEVCIGVDFGTSNSCCGVFINGSVKIAPNKIGERITPSVFLLERNEIEKKDDLIVGEQTLCKNITNLKNYIYEIKRFMGLSYEEFEASGFKNSLNYEVGNKDGTPVIKMEYDGQMRDFTVEEISSHIIKNIIQNAEDFISQIHDKQGLKITNAVFTIPTQFTEKQRNSIIDAAKLAGIKVPRVIYEPTAAALAYGIGHDLVSCEEAKKISKRNLFSSTILGDDYTVAPSANEAIKFEETVLAVGVNGFFDACGKPHPWVAHTGCPVQNVHADSGISNGHEVASEGALGIDLHRGRSGRVKRRVRQALDVVTADDFWKIPLDEIDERLVAVSGNLALEIDLNEQGVIAVANGPKPNLAERLAEYVQVLFLDLLENARH